MEVQLEDDGKRIDAFLAGQIAWKSRSAIQKLIKAGRVFRGERCAKASDKVKHLERVSIALGHAADTHPDAAQIPLAILRQDDHLIVLNKQAGMLVHPAGGNRMNTLMAALHARFRSDDPSDDRVPKLCHRLDKDTSGVWVVALTDAARAALGGDFQHRRVSKEYFALVRGEPDFAQRAVELPIGRDPDSEVLLKRTTDGRAHEPQPAWTDVTVLERFPGAAAVSAKPRTGRTHQIRVHLAGIGHPILHDPLYGPEHRPEAWLEEGHGVPPLRDAAGEVLLDRQALHAWRLRCTHPATGEALDLEAPPTADLERTMEWLRAGGLAGAPGVARP